QHRGSLLAARRERRERPLARGDGEVLAVRADKRRGLPPLTIVLFRDESPVALRALFRGRSLHLTRVRHVWGRVRAEGRGRRAECADARRSVSSGKNATTATLPTTSSARRGAPSAVYRRGRRRTSAAGAKRVISKRVLSAARQASTVTRESGAPHRIISTSSPAREDSPRATKCTASRMFVLPAPFGPTKAVTPVARSSVLSS